MSYIGKKNGNPNTDFLEAGGELENHDLVNVDSSGNVNLDDNKKVQFGASNDLQIYHSGSASVISDQGTGNLYIRGTDIQMTDSTGNVFAKFVDDGTGGTVELYDGASKKFETTSTGVDVTGDIQASGHIESTGGAGYLLGKTTLRSSATFTLSTSAQDIYQDSSNLIGTGTYLLIISLNGSNWYSETWSGIFQFYGGATNDNNATDIYLTGAGHSNVNGRHLYARFKRYVGNNSDHGLQVWTNSAGNGTTPYITIDVKRLF